MQISYSLEELRQYRIGVLCGGVGAERDVSLASGDNVFKALTSSNLNVEKYIVPELDAKSYVNSLDCDIAVLMLHGEFGEDGQVQSILENKNIFYTGSTPLSCRLAMDKYACKELFVTYNIPTARSLLITPTTDLNLLLEFFSLTFPVVVKPNSKGSSVGISLVRSTSDLSQAIDLAKKIDDCVLVEEYIPGREMTVGWLAGEVLPVIELQPANDFYDYEAKYQSNSTKYICPAELDSTTLEQINNISQKVCKILGVRDLSRVDIILNAEGLPQVLEVNTLPGFTSHSLLPMAAQALGISFTELCLYLVYLAVSRS